MIIKIVEAQHLVWTRLNEFLLHEVVSVKAHAIHDLDEDFRLEGDFVLL